MPPASSITCWRRSSARALEPVADAALALEVARGVGVVAQLLAQAAYVLPQTLHGTAALGPDAVENERRGEHAPGVACQQLKQARLGGGQSLDWLAVAQYLAAGEVDLQAIGRAAER